jgi:hypothetical protein
MEAPAPVRLHRLRANERGVHHRIIAQTSFHVLPATCRPIPPNFDRFQRLKCHFLQRSSGRLPDSAVPERLRTRKVSSSRMPPKGLPLRRIAPLTSMVPITYAKKLKNCFKLDPRCPKAEEVRFLGLSPGRITANVLFG